MQSKQNETTIVTEGTITADVSTMSMDVEGEDDNAS